MIARVEGVHVAIGATAFNALGREAFLQLGKKPIAGSESTNKEHRLKNIIIVNE